jgi:calcium/calmodulin-dependent protein kinase I
MHRDLKPENLLFKYKDNFENLLIVDYGLASFSDRFPYIFPKCGKYILFIILGTPGFVAPEIANLVDK